MLSEKAQRLNAQSHCRLLNCFLFVLGEFPDFSHISKMSLKDPGPVNFNSAIIF